MREKVYRSSRSPATGLTDDALLTALGAALFGRCAVSTARAAAQRRTRGGVCRGRVRGAWAQLTFPWARSTCAGVDGLELAAWLEALERVPSTCPPGARSCARGRCAPQAQRSVNASRSREASRGAAGAPRSKAPAVLSPGAKAKGSRRVPRPVAQPTHAPASQRSATGSSRGSAAASAAKRGGDGSALRGASTGARCDETGRRRRGST